MPGSPDTPVVVCYISGLDQRRVHPESTPFLARAFGEMPWVPLTNVPSNELFPTLVTGVDPTQHQVWGVKLKPSSNGRFPVRVVDYLPDWASTTVQGLLHLATGTFDLAAIPPSRRRRFEITRTKYKRRRSHAEALYAIGGIPSIFDVIGRASSRYIFDSGYDPVRRLLPRLASDGCLAEIVELYSLDRFQQWNLDRPDAVQEFYGRMDDFLGRLHDKCRRVGKVLVIVSDHGHEPIQRSIDVFQKLRDLSVPGDEYTCFVEVSSVRFWFHSEAARRAITDMVLDIGHGRLIPYGEMAQYGIPLSDDRYGEYFYFLDPGSIFFPHDFHQPLANLWLGITDRMQRSRLRDPRHRGNHGHLPHFDAERSFIALLDAAYEAERQPGHILDVAPTILHVVGREPPPGMAGRRLFRAKGGP